MEFKIS